MAQILFKSEENLTNDWLIYIEQEAHALSQGDEFTIENYADRELLNPEVQEYLLETYRSERNAQEDPEFPKAVNFHEKATLALSFDQGRVVAGKAALFGFWNRTKQTVRKIFCEVTATLVGDENIDWKDTIRLILIALIPAFASGIPAIILPIVIALLAALMKYGYGKVCPLT